MKRLFFFATAFFFRHLSVHDTRSRGPFFAVMRIKKKNEAHKKLHICADSSHICSFYPGFIQKCLS